MCARGILNRLKKKKKEEKKRNKYTARQRIKETDHCTHLKQTKQRFGFRRHQMSQTSERKKKTSESKEKRTRMKDGERARERERERERERVS